MPVCLECNQYKRSLAYSHLKSCCGLTPKQYKEKHPGCELMDEDLRVSYSRSGELNGNYRGGSKKWYCTTCGQEKGTPEEGICVSCSIKAGHRSHLHTAEDLIKMSKAAKKRDPSTRHVIILTPETIQKANATKKKNWDKLTPEAQYERLKNFIKTGGSRKKDTSIELLIKKTLDDLGMIEGEEMDYKRNITIGRYNVDFLIHDYYIIECFGDYWHRNPKFYNVDDKEAEEIWKSDAKKREFLQNKGFEFINLWECDIHKDPSKIDQELKKFFRSFLALFEWESCYDR